MKKINRLDAKFISWT